ncbi:hypothetical protein AB3N04_00945 (plasmid) [Alkalihalophilus sp. As8PL]|uniref:Uncharacterized protein n=1 Tax=Alkalihalophilus sp. As8PL TaxID=3237103 RepID=A0AB39BMM5_9BACI
MQNLYTSWFNDEMMPNVYILRRDIELTVGKKAMVSIADGKATIFRHPKAQEPFLYVTAEDYYEDPIEYMIREVELESRTLFYYDEVRKTVIKSKAAERLLTEDDALDIFLTLSRCYEIEDGQR